MTIGSTSTKLALFENEDCLWVDTIRHPSPDLARFHTVLDQEAYRKQAILSFLSEHQIPVESIDCFACWGGQIENVEDGVYRITDKFVDAVMGAQSGIHPSDLGPKMFLELSRINAALAVVVDPPNVDEFNRYAPYTGMPEIKRKLRVHTLNQKAVARRYARDIGRAYQDLRLIVTHMGGGISVAAHEHGMMVDGNNGLDGNGPMATNRAGTVPAGSLVDLCFSGKYASAAQVRNKLIGDAGLVAYLGENDSRIIEKRIAAGDAPAEEVYQAMIYQIGKEIGSMASVLKGRVDAVIFTGGMANSKYLIGALTEYVQYIAPVVVYPGELEMESMAISSYQALTGKIPIKEL